MAAVAARSERYKPQREVEDLALVFRARSGDRRALDEVIRRYPYSSSAASAKLELKRIKY